MRVYLPYAGVGARKVPKDQYALINKLGKRLDELGLTLRSGGAAGCDAEFERNVFRSKEIFRPLTYNGRLPNGHFVMRGAIRDKAEELISATHPRWNFLSPDVKELHVRNAFQILGADLESPSLFVLCWTADGADGIKKKTSDKTGGTGTAIRLAALHGIPVINLMNPNALKELNKLLTFFGLVK